MKWYWTNVHYYSIVQGVFLAVVVALIAREQKPHFFINRDRPSPTFPTQLRYAIVLDTSVHLFGFVLLVDGFYWIEVYYSGLIKNYYILHMVICAMKLLNHCLIGISWRDFECWNHCPLSLRTSIKWPQITSSFGIVWGWSSIYEV